MVVTLTTSGAVVFTFGAGDLESVQSNVSTDLDFDSMPGSTADSAMLFDFNGVKKTIRISGQLSNNGANKLSSGSAITINEQRQWLEKTLNGFQTALQFSSNYSSTWNGVSWLQSVILFSSVTFTEQIGSPSGLPFEITLFVGNA